MTTKSIDLGADTLVESSETIPTITPLEAAQEDLQERCSSFIRMAHDWQNIPADDLVGRARIEGMMEMAADEIERRRREYARKGLKVYVVHSRGGAPIRVDKHCKLEMWQ